jgi:hypothetical protein
VPLLIAKNVSKPLRTTPLSHVTNKLTGLVNGNIVTFCGFVDSGDSDGNVQTGQIVSAPAYMLVRVPDSKVKIGDFPVGIIPLERSKILFQVPKGSMGATYQQFGVTLAYAITAAVQLPTYQYDRREIVDRRSQRCNNRLQS